MRSALDKTEEVLLTFLGDYQWHAARDIELNNANNDVAERSYRRVRSRLE